MAEAFVGLTIDITLKDPQGVVVRGLVAEVHPESLTLVLNDVYFYETGTKLDYWTVAGPQIADIRMSAEDPLATKWHDQVQRDPIMPPPPQLEKSEDFVDPAIVSYGKRQGGATQAPSMTHASIKEPAQHHTLPFVGQAAEKKAPVGKVIPLKKKAHTKPEVPVGSFEGLGINDAADVEPPYETDGPPLPRDAARRISVTRIRSGKPMDDGVNQSAFTKGKRSQRQKKGGQASSTPAISEALFDPVDASPVKKGAAGNTYKGKGWRQTPILQPSTEPTPPNPGVITGPVGRQAASSNKRVSRQQKALERDGFKSGWATEDATDIQELPEFDFVGNLSKFDKQTVFDQIRNDDLTTDGERLVSHNRARPGTYGGKNLHPTEMVLDSPTTGPRRHRAGFISSSSSVDLEFEDRANHRATSRRPLHRSNSALGMEDPMTASIGSIGRAKGLRPGYLGSSSVRTGSPAAPRFTPPESPSTYPHPPSQPAHFRIRGSNRPCPTVTPGGMLAIEEFAETEFGLSPEIITENAGRGIAEVAMRALAHSVKPATSSSRDGARRSRPSVLVLVGDHRAGARALVAARHLRNRNVKVAVCVLGSERQGQQQELSREVKAQADLVSRSDIPLRSWSETKQQLRQAEPDLVLEAVLACNCGLEGLAGEDVRTARDMIAWVNARVAAGGGEGRGTGVSVVSVDAPSGIHGSTGQFTLPPDHTPSFHAHDFPPPHSAVTSPHLNTTPSFPSFTPPAIQATHIASTGAPRLGLLRYLSTSSSSSIELVGKATSPALPTSSSFEYSSAGGRGEHHLPLSSSAAAASGVEVYVVDTGVNRAWREYGVLGAEVGGVRFGDGWAVSVEVAR